MQQPLKTKTLKLVIEKSFSQFFTRQLLHSKL